MKDETGKIVFDADEQTEVNRIVEERLARERGKFADYEDLKEVDAILTEFGYQGSVSEKKAILRQQAEEAKAQRELEELKKQAESEGTSPELLREMRELKKELAEIKREKLESQKAQQEEKERAAKNVEKIKEFEEAYPDVDLEKLNNDEDFIEFLKDSNPNLSLVKVYERYNKYVHGAEHKAIAKIQSNLERSTSSGKDRGTVNYHGLSSDERKTVDDWNKQYPKMKMTYEEFANNKRR